MDEHKQDEHEDIEKKLDIFHILNGILAKTRIIIFSKKGFLVVSWIRIRMIFPRKALQHSSCEPRLSVDL